MLIFGNVYNFIYFSRCQNLTRHWPGRLMRLHSPSDLNTRSPMNLSCPNIHVLWIFWTPICGWTQKNVRLSQLSISLKVSLKTELGEISQARRQNCKQIPQQLSDSKGWFSGFNHCAKICADNKTAKWTIEPNLCNFMIHFWAQKLLS